MAYLEEIYQNKNKIINLLINSQEIVDTINNTSIETADELIGQNVFRNLYIPDTQSEAKTYICIEIYITRVTDKLIKKADIHFWIFSHQSISDTGLGYTRVDYIQSQIDRIMNGNYNFGIDSVNLIGSNMFKPNANFGGVELIYRVTDFNQDRIGGFDTVKSRNQI